MHQLKSEQRLSSISAGGKLRYMKEVRCHECHKAIRFMISMPNLCDGCMAITTFPSHLFGTVKDRLEYYNEETQ